MNVEGADVERRLGRTLMPRFHAGFSLGTVIGAGSARRRAAGISVSTQLFLLAALAAVVMLLIARRFLPYPRHGRAAPTAGPRRLAGAADAADRCDLLGSASRRARRTTGWRSGWSTATARPRRSARSVRLLRGGDDLGRLFGGVAIERWGRVLLRGTAASALAGLLLVVSGIAVPAVLVGALLWGAGASLGFPVGMSAAADDPLRAAIRVSVAGSIGYGAFLAGPPLIGLLAEHFGVLRALLVVLAAIGLGLAASGAARPLMTGEPASVRPPRRLTGRRRAAAASAVTTSSSS